MCRVCNKCGVELTTGDNWLSSCSKKHDYICKTCLTRRSMLYESKNRDRVNKRKNEYRYKIGIRTPMSENKACSKYLGCHVAERVLSKVFKDVEVMPPNHPGYDFVCNKGKKIDVKAGCIKHTNAANTMGWQFHIDKNEIADYFLCLAFDNITDLNPLHMWLLPAEKFNHLTNAGISINTVDKWNKYKLDIDKVIECRNIIKESE